MGGDLFRQLQNSDLGYVIGGVMALVVFYSFESNRFKTTKCFVSIFKLFIHKIRNNKRMFHSEGAKKQPQTKNYPNEYMKRCTERELRRVREQLSLRWFMFGVFSIIATVVFCIIKSNN